MEPNDLDRLLKRTLAHPRHPDPNAMARRAMNAIRAEREAETPPGWWTWLGEFRNTQISARRLAVGFSLAAVVLVLVLMRGLERSRPTALNYGPPVPPTATANSLLARTDSQTSLLADQWHLVTNDPLLRPHSIWDQKPASSI